MSIPRAYPASTAAPFATYAVPVTMPRAARRRPAARLRMERDMRVCPARRVPRVERRCVYIWKLVVPRMGAMGRILDPTG